MLNSKLEIGGFTWNDRLELCISNCLVFRMCHSFKSKATEKNWEKKTKCCEGVDSKSICYSVHDFSEYGIRELKA